jgi:hypothetical protein
VAKWEGCVSKREIGRLSEKWLDKRERCVAK